MEAAVKWFDLTGRAALVTGGNGGIGLGMARGFVQAGARVMIVGRDRQKNAEAVRELTSLGVKAASVAADLADEAACQSVVKKTVTELGCLDVLVNNAGIGITKRPEELSLAEWRQTLDINLTSAFVLSQAAYPELKRARRGKIINIGSMMSLFGAPFAAAYAASKGGLVQLTKALATAWAGENIQVNAVLPGWIDTSLTRMARRNVEGLDEQVLERTPAGRWGVPEDLAGIAVFLASDASDFITGAAIPVDGGYSARG
jgi:2-dehydro-3-deoxy-D-gluconate 5-dehydrogenase